MPFILVRKCWLDVVVAVQVTARTELSVCCTRSTSTT
jgi:hypothetical protein